MREDRPPRFKRSFRRFPPEVDKAFEKQARFPLQDIRHPSLRAKKYDESNDIWQARVNRNVRFFFTIKGDLIILLDIEKHRG